MVVGPEVLRECTDAAFMRNVKSLVALGAYSHETLKAMVAQTGIEYHRLEKGIGHYFTIPVIRAGRRLGRIDAWPGC